jgi:methyl-accepting chemotaxis protein
MVLKDENFLQTVSSSAYVESNGFVRGPYPDLRYIVSAPIENADTKETVGIVIASIPQTTTQGVLQQLSDFYLLVSLLVVLVAVIVMTLYARSVSAPLRDMARAASAFGHGDLTARVKTRRRAPEEIREFSLAFNNMADSLQKSETQRNGWVSLCIGTTEISPVLFCKVNCAALSDYVNLNLTGIFKLAFNFLNNFSCK